jgi:hypothetical protein
MQKILMWEQLPSCYPLVEPELEPCCCGQRSHRQQQPTLGKQQPIPEPPTEEARLSVPKVQTRHQIATLYSMIRNTPDTVQSSSMRRFADPSVVRLQAALPVLHTLQRGM